MRSTMMDFPLSVQMILRHGARIHANSRVGTFDGAAFAYARFAEVARRAERLASERDTTVSALAREGLEQLVRKAG